MQKKNHGQMPLPGINGHLEKEEIKNELPNGMPPFREINTECARVGLTDDDARYVYDIWLMNGFTMRTGKRIRNWKAAIRIWQTHNYFPSQKKAPLPVDEYHARQEAAMRRFKEAK
jgi:hypothetical protein